MSNVAYFIGGPWDLSKHTMEEVPFRYMVPEATVPTPTLACDGTIQPSEYTEHVYRSEARVADKTFVYVYEGVVRR